MPIHAVLRSPAVQNLAAATTAGLVTLVRPARFPRWARRTLRWANTAGTIGSVYLARKEVDEPGLGIRPVSGRAKAVSIASAVSAAASGLGVVTSGLGIAADRKVEAFLVRKGVRHPRLWIAVGVVGVVFALKTGQNVAAKRADGAAKALGARQHAAQPPAGAAARPAPAAARPAPVVGTPGAGLAEPAEHGDTAAIPPAHDDTSGTAATPPAHDETADGSSTPQQ